MNLRTVAASTCEKLGRARAFVFPIKALETNYGQFTAGDSNNHRNLDARFADAFLTIVEGDLARRLAVIMVDSSRTCLA